MRVRAEQLAVRCVCGVWVGVPSINQRIMGGGLVNYKMGNKKARRVCEGLHAYFSFFFGIVLIRATKKRKLT